MPASPSPDLTSLLSRARSGDEAAAGELMPLLYDHLRGIARAQIAKERAGHTLQATALLHEAWIRLDGGAAAPARDRQHFFALAARSMRQILVDHARRKAAGKRGGDGNWERVTLDVALGELDRPDLDLLALEGCLEALEAKDARKARVVELRFFGGLPMPEIAALLGTSLRTVEQDWYLARAWLRKQLGEAS